MLSSMLDAIRISCTHAHEEPTMYDLDANLFSRRDVLKLAGAALAASGLRSTSAPKTQLTPTRV